ncbi:MAG: hypothetical protein IJ797_02815, partial [Selenomonadaceae bacterium]|nr:hypothetical protein [Selenomonadaceae bacterium]
SDNGSNYIYNSGSNVTIDSGADKDTIISSGSNVTLNANTGSDLISLSSYAGNNVIEYAEGDGNDTIYGYGTDDTIYISSATYTTTASGSDTFIYVGDGFMMIKDAANTSLNIVDNNRDNTPADTTPADTTPADTTPADTTPAYDFTLTLTDKDKKTVKASSDVTIIDASARTKATKITANANNNTIIGGKGKDTVTFGNGLDLFMYSNGDGKDVITDYIEGEDIIEITSGTISSSSIKSSDVVFTIGSGSITVKKGKNKTVTIKDSDGNTSSRVYGNEMFITDADNAKVTAKSKVTLIDASARTEDIYIVGNSKANTIIGGTGNNTLKGGSGKDLFVYSAGNNIITDYKTGQDTIQLASASIISSTLNGSNVIINTDKGDITVNKAKNKKITVIDSEGNKTSQVYGEPTLPAGVTLNSAKTIMTVTDTFADDIIDLANYDKVKKVNAANLTSDVQIIGGSKAVSIKSGSGDDTLTGTAKNDTLTGGAGSDTFIYTGGKDVITDYSSEEDEIQISNGTVTKATVSGKNVKFTVAMASGTGALTIKNGKGKQIDLINSDGTVISETYTKTTKLNNFVEKINAEIFNSDNYISSDNTELDSIINLVTDDAVSTEELYNTSVDATSITQVTSAVYKKIDK